MIRVAGFRISGFRVYPLTLGGGGFFDGLYTDKGSVGITTRVSCRGPVGLWGHIVMQAYLNLPNPTFVVGSYCKPSYGIYRGPSPISPHSVVCGGLPHMLNLLVVAVVSPLRTLNCINPKLQTNIPLYFGFSSRMKSA